MKSGQIRESCGGCNNAGCRSFSFCGRPKAEFALRHFGKKGNARCAHSNSLRSLLSVFPCGSPMALWEKGNTHCVRSCACGYAVQPALQIALRLFGQDGKHRSALARGGVLLDSACRFPARVEFQACFRQKPTAVHFSFTAMAFSCP